MRQMLEAKSYRHRQRGEAPVDVETTMASLLDSSAPPPAADAELRAEVRQLVIARNERRMRQGQKPLDVEAETERQLAQFRRIGLMSDAEKEDQENLVELEEMLMQPGTYFNPQTEVLIVVDDSTSLDQEIFNMEKYEGADWVRISDDVPVDEDARDGHSSSSRPATTLGRPDRCPRPPSNRATMSSTRMRTARTLGARTSPSLTRVTMLEAGQKAPAFTLLDQDGKKVKLTDFKGETVVVYFYPRAETPGCTTQACGIRDRGKEYRKLGARVLGISPDEPAALRKFADNQKLDFTLLADPDHKVAERYGAWGEKSMYGKKYMGILRNTYIVDAKGKIAHVLPKVQPKKHDDLVLKALGELAAPA